MKTLRTALVILTAIAAMGLASAQADQPQMHEALRALNEARNHLQNASHDKGGHRAKALEHVNQAIAEVERGMEFDRHH